jgi:SAM-dependent methyltransferase
VLDRQQADQKVLEFCEGLWGHGDPWSIETSAYERTRCARLLTMLEGRRYARVLEIGCGAGYFTRLIAPLADEIVALDVAPAAIARAQRLGEDLKTVDFRVGNVMDYTWQTAGPWDLVVFCDTICYLGWQYSFFDVAWLASALLASMRDGGRLLMANSMGEVEDKLLLPFIIRTYRDLFVNAGYCIDAEEVFRGTKNGVEFDILMSLFMKPLTPIMGNGRV